MVILMQRKERYIIVIFAPSLEIPRVVPISLPGSGVSFLSLRGAECDGTCFVQVFGLIPLDLGISQAT